MHQSGIRPPVGGRRVDAANPHDLRPRQGPLPRPPNTLHPPSLIACQHMAINRESPPPLPFLMSGVKTLNGATACGSTALADFLAARG